MASLSGPPTLLPEVAGPQVSRALAEVPGRVDTRAARVKVEAHRARMLAGGDEVAVAPILLS